MYNATAPTRFQATKLICKGPLNTDLAMNLHTPQSTFVISSNKNELRNILIVTSSNIINYGCNILTASAENF